MKFPGFAAANYEMLLNILLEEVVGWDKRNNRSTEKEGLFGMCEAICLALEEQGRKSLHGHMTLWIKHFDELRRKMLFARLQAQKDKAKKEVVQYYDRLVTTKLFDTDSRSGNVQLLKSFDHECSIAKYSERNLPLVTGPQNLRNFCHIKGYKHEQGVFAFCPHCSEKWTYEQLLTKYVMIHGEMIDNTFDADLFLAEVDSETDKDKKGPPIPTARMQAKVLEFQKYPDRKLNECPTLAINALYNAHRSMHKQTTCFKCKKLPAAKRRKHKHDEHCECRMRIPDLSRFFSEIHTLLEASDWYNFRGEPKEQRIVEIVPKRRRFDLFQNTSVAAITESKMSCNTNMSLCVDGPVVMLHY